MVYIYTILVKIKQLVMSLEGESILAIKSICIIGNLACCGFRKYRFYCSGDCLSAVLFSKESKRGIRINLMPLGKIKR